ncbi:MAG: DNA topoisomerase 4 subunit A [Acidimicrobiales bacterium]|nr:DNA topoisomerase 4 subunit A [Acidimicrobiales bacterium]
MSRQEELIPFAREIVDVPVSDEMSESFLAYSLSVITSRAIPDVRDGLKPVQRRILYSMLDMGLRPENPHRKCARVVGDTMGKYHPHGDMAIYEALVRMGQDFARMITLVDPHGNFGSLDDPPAAPRYTECRLTNAAMEMVLEIGEDTVDFRPTYDGESEEPVCLPGLLPNLLVNGTTGIAVGMATNMPTHNLREVFEAIKLVMTKRRPRPTIDELMAVLPGPDFPSGGIIVDDGLRDAYETGRGSFRIRARYEIEQVTKARQAIVVTELPYMVGPEKLVKRINELAQDDKLVGVVSANDLSDRRHGLRVQITLKPNVNAQAVLPELFRQTPMEETFGVNNVVLVDGAPVTLGLYDLCHHYVEHRLDVVVRRTEFRLAKYRDELHIVEGLVIALDNIDRVIEIIRSSADTPAARQALCDELALSELQATHILDMPLKRLTALEKQKILDRRDELLRLIDDLEKLLASEQRQRTVVLKELQEIVEVYGTDRRTEIIGIADLPDPAEIPPLEAGPDLTDEPCLVTLSTSGVVGRTALDGGRRTTPGRHDVIAAACLTTTLATVIAVTSEGRALSARSMDISEVSGRSRGTTAAEVFGTNKGEQIHCLMAGGAEPLTLVTTAGVVKRLSPDEVAGTKSGRTLISLKGNDKVAAAFTCPDGADFVIVASDAQALRTPVDAVSMQGRGAGGVAGMRLREGATVVGAGPAIGDGAVVSVTDLGTCKVTPFEELPSQGRGSGGVRLTRFTKESRLELVHVSGPDMLLAVMSTDDDPRKPDPTPVPLPVEPSKRDLVSIATERRILDVGPARW